MNEDISEINEAFSGQFAASEEAKEKMEFLSLRNEGVFKEMSDVWRLGAALALLENPEIPDEIRLRKRKTAYNVSALDPDGIFSAVMISLFPELKPDERRKKLEEYAEWGIREIYRRYTLGTLNFTKIIENIINILEEERA